MSLLSTPQLAQVQLFEGIETVDGAFRLGRWRAHFKAKCAFVYSLMKFLNAFASKLLQEWSKLCMRY